MTFRKSLSIRMIFYILISFVNSAADGFLSVKTSPEKIEVWLNDNFIGNSPILYNKLKAGSYALKLIDPVARTSFRDSLIILDNDTTFIEKFIESKYGVLTISTVPPGASVFISSELGKTPLCNNFMNPGNYRLEIRPDNSKFLPAVENIQIINGNTTSVIKKLEKEKVLNRNAKIRLVLGVGCVAGFVFAIIENGMYQKYDEKISNSSNINSDMIKKRKTYNLMRILGITGGSLCLTGLEIVSFLK